MTMETTLAELAAKLDRIEELTLIGAKAVLDIEEAALYTGFTKTHLYTLTSERRIPHYKKGRKLYFKKAELEDWMLESRVLTEDEIEGRAETYLATRDMLRRRTDGAGPMYKDLPERKAGTRSAGI